MDQRRRGGWIQTFLGLPIWPLDPRPEEIRIEDIAHALAHQCRFAGHTKSFYSVAQHCVHVSEVCQLENSLFGLLHDASEAYLQDVARPLKELPGFEFYRVAECALQRVIFVKFGLAPSQPPNVTLADDAMLSIEYRDLMSPARESALVPPPNPLATDLSITSLWSPETAERRFLSRFFELHGGVDLSLEVT